MSSPLSDFVLDKEAFLKLLAALIKETPHLQNNPPEFVPQEDRAGNHVLERLRPFSKENGGPLEIQHISYVPGRGNIVVKYPGTSSATVSFIGSHLDVVPAGDLSKWTRNPFELIVEGDTLWGRGVTDCLGHVALLTEFFALLDTKKPNLAVTVAAVFIASEENNSVPDVGVEMLCKDGKVDFMKNGPVYWVDSANTHPCIGTGGAAAWQLTATGKLFHSGLPHKAINAMELAIEALSIIQKRFYEDFPPHEKEAEYLFETSSTLKPTQWSYPGNSVNQIPESATICGDIRLTPFYNMHDCMKKVESYVAEINQNVTALPCRGPSSKYELQNEGRKGEVTLTWLGEPLPGIACNLQSEGYKAMYAAVEKLVGECKPYSLTGTTYTTLLMFLGSLPLVGDLQASGFDVQVTGFGRMEAYHAFNEFGLYSEFERAFRIIAEVVANLNAKAAQ